MTITTNKAYTIKEIEAMTEADVFTLAEDRATVKGYTLYFVDFGQWFGYSVAVFADGQHITHANDYAMHHKGRTREELHALYLDKMSHILFTRKELQTISGYKDHKLKEYYIRNYYSMRRPYVSMFYIGDNAPDVSGMIFSPVAFAYYAAKDADFVQTMADMLHDLESAQLAAADDFGYWKNAFLTEMHNHEYGINWQADYDVCSCFGPCSGVQDHESLSQLFDACQFSDLQRNAYRDARAEYFRTVGNL